MGGDEVDQLQTDYLNHQASKGYDENQRSAAMGAYQILEVKKVAKSKYKLILLS